MTTKHEWTDADIGCRVVYSGRNGNSRLGTMTDIIQVGNMKMLNLKLDGSSRERFYVPEDTVTLVPDEVSNALGSSD